ncbi:MULTISPECIES: hypothetical protein [Isoptericola]|uniref:Uncharacterized protein n=1 Tax=Isoptericola sediminis TaxID=2733572 RepID=A0A849K3K2_9MICO|nr:MULTISPECIES: hypothetical protein [Isoptericola]MDO8143590.1 hypothetical protein [Isoptericola sp. 178]MDO8147456.1 hypothetical protein [Isoptericola sp. b515]MDO8150235.1 hypothetical protein [Isoptericola sp. b408]NNU26619.1 hypothetical protein [Isoptericola sediminis]
MSDSTTRPVPRTYPPTPTSEPVSDELLVVHLKGRDTEYFRRPELISHEVGDGVLTVTLAGTGDTPRRTRHFPLGEVLEYVVEAPSAAYETAFDAWTRAEFGVDAETYRSMRDTSEGVAMAEKMRRQIAEGLGVDPDQVHFGGSFTIDEDDDWDSSPDDDQ